MHFCLESDFFIYYKLKIPMSKHKLDILNFLSNNRSLEHHVSGTLSSALWRGDVCAKFNSVARLPIINGDECEMIRKLTRKDH